MLRALRFLRRVGADALSLCAVIALGIGLAAAVVLAYLGALYAAGWIANAVAGGGATGDTLLGVGAGVLLLAVLAYCGWRGVAGLVAYLRRVWRNA